MRMNLNNAFISIEGTDARLLPAFSADWCFFLDIDGTLVDFSDHPDMVRVDVGLHALMRRLVNTTGEAVALISGRAIASIDRLFSPLRFPVAGQHGWERRDYAGRIHVHTLPAAGLSNAVAQLEKLAAQYPKLIFEHKGQALAMHYRRAPSLAPYVDALMRQLLATLGNEFELLAGKMMLELRPCGRDKSTAIAEFLRELPFRGRVPVFIGDDVTDECGFALVNQLSGHAVKVGEGATAARSRLSDVTAVRAWLAAFADHHDG